MNESETHYTLSIIDALDSYESILDLRSVNFSHSTPTGVVPILSDVNFSIRRGETVSVEGKSGCGKTTFALLCIGMLQPDTGTVIRPPERRGQAYPIQMVFQDPYESINPRRTVEEWFSMCLKHRRKLIQTEIANMEGTDKFELRDLAMELLKLPKYIMKMTPRQLSGGQCQRCCIASAVLTAPDLLILDEPLSMQDPGSSGYIFEFLSEMRSIHDFSVIIISHKRVSELFKIDKYYFIDNKKLFLVK
ncbi:MAG: ATP-binding cassette domain-containing protein [Candidatus Thiodiazotropha endolucinida]